MNRRIFASLAAAAALAVLPSAAAQAYVAPGVDLEVTDTTPAPGQAIQVVFEGTTVGESYTLTITSNPTSIPSSSIQIAGTASSTKVAASDSVAWTVTLQQAGSYAAAITDADGTLLASSTLVVAAPGATPAPSGSGLATTGSDPLALGLGAAGISVLGVATVLVVRRRQSAARS
ncbi:hypothetical protein [Cellulomonas flavigena]|uniref:hypothetical protein n=1 Tax=Cellulomonas flavigena TaxID=1711 RepID=UPI0002DA3C49|nr:hypothetical protein [Cellulomonas flavigena]